jgi:ABC-type uncharacterized transport system permease subunit
VDAEIKRQWAHQTRQRWIAFGIGVLVVVVAFIVGHPLFLSTAIVLAVLGVVLASIHFRICPGCNANTELEPFERFCPQCGSELR